MEDKIDLRSYRLGSFGAFSEMVKAGVKTLALSSAISPEEMDAMFDAAKDIATIDNLMLYRETDLIVTDLFPADVALGKHVLLIYKGNTLEEYFKLKNHKTELVEKDKYSGDARREVAKRFGRLLSYPENVIENKIDRSRP